jgi:uncharacterized protein (TIGR01777 family)
MPRYASSVYVPVSPAEAWAWLARPSSSQRLLPPWSGIRITRAHRDLVDGDVQSCSVPCGPVRLSWSGEYIDCQVANRFCERQLHGPYAEWEHVRRFEAEDDGCRLQESLDYRLPLGALGRALAGPAVEYRTAMLSAWRNQRILADLARLRDYRSMPPLRVAISGTGGLVGGDLAAFLSSGGHTVLPLVRSAAPVDGGIRWDPARDEIDGEMLSSCDAVVHLGGHPIAGRWNARRRALIRDSRVRSTRLLAETLAKMSKPPRVLVVASAIGWYGDRHEEYVDEMSSPGSGFMAEVCRDWEAACEPARAAGIRVVNLRIGMVLSAKGGALPALLAPYRYGLGAVLGSGEQWVSWIAIDDLVYLLHHALRSKTLRGAVNAVAPSAVRQRDLATVAGRILSHRPHLRLPGGLLRLMGGEMAQELLLGGARVISRQLEQETFAFSSPDLEQALRWELGRFALRTTSSEPLSDSSWSM